MSLLDAHYGRAATAPVRAIRPRTPGEIAFLSPGPGRGSVPARGRRRGHEPARGRARPDRRPRAQPRPGAAVGGARAGARVPPLPGGRRALDPRGRAGRAPPPGAGRAARHRAAGGPGPVPRGLCPGARRDDRGVAAALAPDLEAALLRLKLSAIRRLAPEVLVTAKVQRWAPDELLRTLLEAELGSRDASNARARLRAAGFPVRKTLEEFLVAESLDPAADVRLPRVASSGSGPARTSSSSGPAGTGKSHTLIALGHAAVEEGFRVRYFAAASLAETLYRGLADNSVGRLIEGLLRADLVIVDDLGFAPLDDTGAQLLFRFVAAAYERRSLGVASHWPFESWGRFLPEHTTAVALLDRLLHHAVTVVTSGDSYRMKEARERVGHR